MKTIEIAGDEVTYFLKDSDGNTVATTLSPEDKNYIERSIEKGLDKGNFDVRVGKTDAKLYWSIQF